MRRLAALYPDTVIAGILNRQGGRPPAAIASRPIGVATFRTHWRIPCFQPKPEVAEGEIMTVAAAAAALSGSAGTSVATETCGQSRPLKLSTSVCEYWI